MRLKSSRLAVASVLALCVTCVISDPEALSVGAAPGQPVVSDRQADLELTADTQRSANPEPFIDRLVSLFSGVSKANKANDKSRPPVYQPQSRPQKPVNAGGGGAYGPPPRPPVRQNINRPPPPAKKPPPPPPRGYQQPSAAPSNNLPTYVSPGGSIFNGGPPPRAPAPPQQAVSANDPWQVGAPANMAQIKDLQVQCEKDMMRVRVIFDRPFYGMIFSKGHYRNANCVHVPANLGQTQATFDIALQSCGMSASGSQGYSQQTPQGSYIENTIIVQYDPQLQEVWDQARRLRCTWYDFYEKAVTFKPYQVDMLDPVTANFLGDNLRCWMQIQVGKGPQASEVSGIVKIGQTMTMVIGVKDDENKFDMMVRNCVAHDGTRAPIQLVDEKGCVPLERQKIMSPFKKIKNFDATANVLSYAYFQAFKFPDSMNVHFQCVVQVCRSQCPAPQCGGTVVPPRSTAGTGGQATSYSQDTYGAPSQQPQQQVDSYGAPQGAPLGQPDSYGAPQGPPLAQLQQKPNPNINPRLPYSADDSFTAPGLFSKRSGEVSGLPHGPRSLEDASEWVDDNPGVIDAKDKKGEVRNALENSAGDDMVARRKKRSSSQQEMPAFTMTTTLVDEEGNEIRTLADAGRVKRETSEKETADVSTTEKVIQVIAPNDVQFHLPTVAERRSDSGSSGGVSGLSDSTFEADLDDSAKEIVINTNTSPADAVCVDATGFVCAAVAAIMVLVIALITIVFLWLRIKVLTANAKEGSCKTILQ